MWVPEHRFLAAITQSGPSPQPRFRDPSGRRGDEAGGDEEQPVVVGPG